MQSPIIDRKAIVDQQQTRVRELRHAKYESIVDDNPGIELVRGHGRFKDARNIVVREPSGEERTLRADRVFISTGASPSLPSIPGLAETPSWTSTDALVAETPPEHVVVIGGSMVALELAQAFQRLGTRVTLVARSSLLSRLDPRSAPG